MSSIQLLRAVVNERLSAAAEEIFDAVKRTIESYEEEILLSKQEIHRQRRMLQSVSKAEIKIVKDTDLALSVWEDGSPCEQQQQQEQEHSEQAWSSSLDQQPQTEVCQKEEELEEEMTSDCREEVQIQELEDNNTISFIFTSPYVKNQLHSNYRASSDGDALPGTSVEQSGEVMEVGDGEVSSGCSVIADDSGEEWKVEEVAQSEDEEGEETHAKTSDLHPAKSAKPRICCKVCGKPFHAIVSLINHMKVHSEDVCGVCGERFDTEESFQAHLKTHVKAGVCGVCGKCFGASSALETHMRIHTGEKPFRCGECGKSFNCRHNMVRHTRTHTGEKPYPCSVCGKSFNDYSTRKRHLLVHQNQKLLESEESKNVVEVKVRASRTKKQQTPCVCELCGKMFHSVVSLVNHAKSHAADLCGVCGTHFESEENLKVHLKTHKNGKVCDVCGKCFDSLASLEMHMRIHTGEKPFLCSECGKSFNCRHNMVRHTRTHTGEKPYACAVCGRSFSDHSSLKHHSATHTGKRPFRCDVCGKGFCRRSYVRLHMKSHATEKLT